MSEDVQGMAIRISMEDSSFSKGMQSLKTQLGVIDSGFKSSIAGIKNWGTSLDGLKANATQLGEKINVQKQIVQQYQAQLDKSKTSLTNSSQAMMELKSKVESAKTAWEQSKATLGENDAATLKLKEDYDDLAAKYSSSERAVLSNSKSVEGNTIQLNNATGKLKTLDSELDKTVKSIDLQSNSWTKMGKSLETMGSKLKTIGEGFTSAGQKLSMGLTAPILGAGVGIGAMMVKASDGAKELQKMAAVTGLSAERLQELTYVGAKVDVSLDTMTGSQKFLTKAMAAAEIGTKAQSKVFKDLGISVVDNTGHLRDSNVVFGEAITALGQMTNPTERNADSLRLFGRSAMALNPLIKTSAGEIANLTDEAHKSGAVISNESVLAMDKFSNSIAALKISVTGAVGKVAAELIPTFNRLLPVIQGQIIPAIGAFAQKIADLVLGFTNLDPFIQKIILGFVGFLVAIGPVLAVGGSLLTVLGGIAEFCGAAAIALGITTTAAAVATPAVAGLGVATAGAGTAATGLGAAFGAALIPLLPWIAGIAAVIAIGIAVKAALDTQVTPAVNLFADRVVTTGTQMTTSMNETSVKITEGTKKAVGAYMELDTKASQSLTDLYMNSTVISKNTANGLIGIYAQMDLQIKAGMDKHYTDLYSSMQTFFSNSKALSTVEEAAILAKMTKDNVIKKTQEDIYNTQIRDIITKASNEKRALTLSEEQQINTIQNTMKVNAVTSLSDTEVQSKVILQRLKDYGANITAEQASTIIKNANHQRDGSVSAAQGQYEKTLANIIQMRDGTHEMTAQQADLAIADAKRQERDSIAHAEGLRSGVVGKITSMNGSIGNSVNTTTGNMLTQWEKLKRWWDSWTPKHVEFKINTSAPSGIPLGKGGLSGMAIGTRYLPADMLIQAHQGEMIVPKSENPYANSGNGKTLPQNNTTINFNGTYSFPDNQSIDYFMNQAAVLVQRRGA